MGISTYMTLSCLGFFATQRANAKLNLVLYGSLGNVLRLLAISLTMDRSIGGKRNGE